MIEYINENIEFFLKIVITHFVTYTLCGMVFYKLNNYGEWVKNDFPFAWRSNNSLIFRLAPVFQIFRGILFGIVLLLIKDSIIDTNFGFLKLFTILSIVGIFNTYGPAEGSIEGFIYRKPVENIPLIHGKALPNWWISVRGLLEVLTQIFIFSVIVTTNWRELISKLFG
jgi:hypothetical protein